MIPLRDSVRSRSRPWVMYALLVINALVFRYELSLGRSVINFFYEYGLIAWEFWQAQSLVDRVVPLITSMFIHVGWVHFLGNMLYLWVFGDNVEDRMGRLRFLAFYLICGAAAAVAQMIVNPFSRVPMIGASGAIAGVLGAYLRLFPGARILALVPSFFFLHLAEVPAVIFLVFWFLIQLAQGALALVAMPAGGPAFWAHIGGFVAGFILAPHFRKKPTIEVLPPW